MVEHMHRMMQSLHATWKRLEATIRAMRTSS